MAISVGSVAVDVVPDTRTFAEQLKAKLKGISADIGITADTAGLREKLDEVTRDLRATVNVDADTTMAGAKIDEVARDRTANVKVDSSGLSAASSGVSGLMVAALALGPALVPITAAVTGLGAALAAPVAAAGGGLTLYGVITGIAVKKTKEQIEEIGKLSDKVSKARLAVAAASTPAGKKSAEAELAADTQAYKQALDELTPSQKRFMDAQGNLSLAFAKLMKVAGPAIFDPLVRGMGLLTKVLPKLRPLLQPVSNAISSLLSEVGNFAKGPGFKAFVAGFGQSAGNAIKTFGAIFGDVARGMFGLFRAFTPLSGPFIKGIADMAQKFADFGKSAGQNKGFQSFLAYVRDVGPKVAATFGHLIQALVKIAIVLAPLGGLVLGLVDGLASLIAKASPGQLAAVAAGIGAIGIAIAIATGGFSQIVPLLVSLAAGLVYAYAHCKPFHDIVTNLGTALRDNVLPPLRDAAATVLPAIESAFSTVAKSVRENHGLFVLLGDAFKLMAGFVLKVWIPVLARVYAVVLPLIGKALAAGITFVHLYADSLLVLAQIGVKAFGFLVRSVLFAFDAILTGAAKAFGWMPDIGPKIKAASAGFHEFRRQTVANLEKTAAKIKHIRDLLDGIKPKPIILDVITRNHAQAKVDRQLGIPRGATGGIVTRPTLAVIGEAGPEAVVPLNRTPGSRPLGNGGGVQEIRGTLSLDRQGVATIHGVARDAVKEGRAQREAVARHRAMGSESFR